MTLGNSTPLLEPATFVELSYQVSSSLSKLAACVGLVKALRTLKTKENPLLNCI